jgi:hypothetical protein
LSGPGGECNGAGDDCLRKNLSQSDYDFIKGMDAGTAFLLGPQDPAKLPNLEVGLMTCITVQR